MQQSNEVQYDVKRLYTNVIILQLYTKYNLYVPYNYNIKMMREF